MNLITFLENRYQELNYESQIQERYSVIIDAQIKAAHQLVSSYRIFLKWLFIPKLIFNFIQMKLGLREAPVPIMVNMIKEQKEREEAEKAAVAEGKVTSIDSTPKGTA